MSEWIEYLEKHDKYASILDDSTLTQMVDEIISSINRGGHIFTFGNGGSAATANHFAADLALMKIRTGKLCRAVSLNSDLSRCTAISNDISYEDAITNELETFAKHSDILVGFSASGNSRNIINGVRTGLAQGLSCFVFLGFDGGEIKHFDGVKVIHFSTPRNYGLVENLHLMATHYVVDLVIQKINSN